MQMLSGYACSSNLYLERRSCGCNHLSDNSKDLCPTYVWSSLQRHVCNLLWTQNRLRRFIALSTYDIQLAVWLWNNTRIRNYLRCKYYLQHLFGYIFCSLRYFLRKLWITFGWSHPRSWRFLIDTRQRNWGKNV